MNNPGYHHMSCFSEPDNCQEKDMKEKAKAAVLASFAADALALGAHWIYDPVVITKTFGRVDRLCAPPKNSYHSKKNKGEFTHYGDQSFVLLESLAEHGSFRLQSFGAAWRRLFTNTYNGYLDKATKTTLDNLEQGKPLLEAGSRSTDLGGAARIAPLVHWYQDDRSQLVQYAKEQTMMTHNHPAALAGAVFLAHTVYAVLHGDHPAHAMEKALDLGVDDLDLDIRIRSAMDASDEDSETFIKNTGQMCAISAALPGAIHLILTYVDDLENALVTNVMAGGDSSARGMAVGMILGAHLGIEGIPQSWLKGMHQYSRMQGLLA